MPDQDPSSGAEPNMPQTASFAEVVREFFGFVSVRGKHEVGRIQEMSRHQLEMRQLRRDRDKRLEKLGREAIALVNAGEIAHPGLAVHIEHIQQLQGRIDTLAEEGPTAHGVADIGEEE